MSEKFNDKSFNPVNVNRRKRDKFLKPLIVDEEVRNPSDAFFSIVKNKKNATITQKEQEKSNFYISPMRGKVVNRATFPATTSKGKIDKQYDFIRSSKKLDEKELKSKYGSEFYEFNLIKNNNEKSREHLKEKLKQTEVSQVIERENRTYEKQYSSFDYEDHRADLRQNEVSQKVYTEPLHILYEEEIDLEDDHHVIASYQDNQHHHYFGDYEKKYPAYQEQTDIYAQKNISVNEYKNNDEKIRAEIKEMFAEFHEEPSKPRKSQVQFEESYQLGERGLPPVKSVGYRESNDIKADPIFRDLKKELDGVLKNNKQEETIRTEEPKTEDFVDYLFPSMDLLNQSTAFISDQTEWVNDQVMRLDATLDSFAIAAKTVNYTIGPSVTRFEVEPEPGTKVSKITALSDDIKMRLAASDIFIEAPISGKSTVGIEVPNKESRMVYLREILESASYKIFKSPLKIALGLDITGQPIFSDISTMTHSLIAGSTGSGKSVCINTIIISILYNALPNEVKLVLIDPKKVEFSLFKDIPHLLTPVINDAKAATATLKWLTEEMDRRYELIESVGARDIKSYNLKRNRTKTEFPKLPYIVVIIDELADLMVVAANEVEEYIQRISQLARAAGIHLIVATQRPSTNVITGTIKTNIPTRISFKVASAIDSRIILDDTGAEKLLGKGDMLFDENGKAHSKRLQGSFISDEEIERVTLFCKEQATPHYQFTSEDLIKKETEFVMDYEDELFDDVVRMVIDLGEASASRIQRHFKVGYNRAARIIDMMEKFDIIGPHLGGSKPREVLMSLESYEEKMDR